MENIEIKKIPVEELIEGLKADGIEIDRKHAELLLDFLCDLTKLVIEDFML